MRRIALIVALAAAALLGAVVAYANLAGISGHSPAGLAALRTERAPLTRINAKVTGLYPGAKRTLAVRVHSRFSHPVRVVRLRTKVKDASPACGREYLRTRRVTRPRKWIAPGATGRLRVRIVMLRSAPDACQGATFPLRLKAKFADRR